MSSGWPADGGGIASDTMDNLTRDDKEMAPADKANLEYARKATDLVLERLKDQQDEPDPELLKSLGWTEEELQAFLARWEAMKRNAREQGGEAPDGTARCAAQSGFTAHRPWPTSVPRAIMTSIATCRTAATEADHRPRSWNNSTPTEKVQHVGNAVEVDTPRE